MSRDVMGETTKYTCIVCGYRTLTARYDWEICPLCLWEDDVGVENDDRKSPANGGMLVSEAQANFVRYGAISEEFIDKVRPPTLDDEKDPNWRLLSSARELLDGRS